MDASQRARVVDRFGAGQFKVMCAAGNFKREPLVSLLIVASATVAAGLRRENTT
jgi:hypothetical protein